jgi:hypothetical protein
MKSDVSPSDLRTRAEATGFQETSLHADVIAFVDELARRSDLVERQSIGTSGEGRDIVALVVSDRRCFTPERARKQKKAIVMIEANIHAGEVEGKEMALALARDLATTKLGTKILGELCLVIVPDFNPDGNDRISPQNRKLDLARLEGQVNPRGGVGTRYTGEGWNLNRDNTKQEAVETQNLARFFQRWSPDLFVDCHTTDGSLHAFDLTFDTSHGNEEVFAALRAFNRDLLERVARAVRKRHGFASYWYGNYVREDDPSSGWHTYPALPRFGSHYRGLLGKLDILLETYSYIPFERRCAVMYAFLLEIVRYAAEHSDEVRSVVAAQEARIVARGKVADPRVRIGIDYGVARRDGEGALVFDYPAHALDGDTAEIEAFDVKSHARRIYPGKRTRTWTAPHLRTFVATTSVTTPQAYLVPAALAERLRGHGIRFTILGAALDTLVESYRILAIEPTFSPDVAALVPPPGAAEIPLSAKPPPTRYETVLSVRPERGVRRFGKGTLHVATAQPAGTLAVYLLEPHSDDGFARWQFLDAEIAVGELFPIHRVIEAVRPPRKAE